jgi:UDP-glucose 4,6-dehydratase
MDEPNFSFRQPPCSFYSGTKALAEESLRKFENNYIWRPGIIFDQFDSPRNFLSEIQRSRKLHDTLNPLSHRGDFVKACLDLWERSAPFGTYNVINPGVVTTRQVVETVEGVLARERRLQFWRDDEEFYRARENSPAGCLLSAGKLLAAGSRMRPVESALEDSLERWNSVTQLIGELSVWPIGKTGTFKLKPTSAR